MSDINIYNSPDWSRRRDRCRLYRRWYEGVPLSEHVPRRDRDTGSKMRRFPLGINLTGLACDIHRDFARGLVPDGDPLVVHAIIDRSDDKDKGESIEKLVNDLVWIPSRGGAIQQEALLSMNVYGGAVFQIAWEPWSLDLPLGIGVRLHRDPSCIFPTWSEADPWRMIDCHIGKMISPSIARDYYNVKADDVGGDVLYLEYWSRDEWWVRVNGQTPTVEWNGDSWPLKGDNPWGFVPVYYIPHERTTDLFGRGVVGDEDIVKEINSRSANISDMIRASWPGMLWGRDLGHQPKVIPVVFDGTAVMHIVDVGRTRPAPSASPPDLGAIPTPNIPDSIVDWPKELLSLWQLTRRISPSVFGMDDTQSGRITGPAVSARMISSTNHAITERINFTTGKTIMDRDIVRVYAERMNAGAITSSDLPEIKAEDAFIGIQQRWPSMLPLDRTEEQTKRIESLKEGGMSQERYLAETGVEDIDGEIELIREWLEFKEGLKSVGFGEPQANDQGGEPRPPGKDRVPKT